MAEKLEAGAAMPEMDLPLAGGGTVHIGGPRETPAWRYGPATALFS